MFRPYDNTELTPHLAVPAPTPTPTPSPDDDSDGELFIEEPRDHRRVSASRSPGSIAAQAASISSKSASAYTVNAPSVYRAPALAPPAAAAPPPPSSSTQAAAEALAGAITVASGDGGGDEKPYGSSSGGTAGAGAAAYGEATAAGSDAGGDGGGGGLTPGPPGSTAEHESMSSQRAIAPDSSAEVFLSGPGGAKGGLAGGLRLGGERMSIPRDGSTLEVRGRHARSGPGLGLCFGR